MTEDHIGVSIAGLMNWNDYFKGVEVSGMLNFSEDLKGVSVAGLMNIVYKKSEGAQYSLLMNKTKRVDESLSQIGLINIVEDNLPEDKFALQFGLYNRIGNQIIPFVNVKGLKNLFKKKKNKGVTVE
jgi:hypothetical protein